MKTGRLNIYVPEPELEAFRKFCKNRGMSQSRVITGLLHTFNAKQQRMEAKELDRFTANLDRVSHVRYEAEKEKGRAMVEAVKQDPSWTTADLESSSSVERESADFLDIE